MKKLLLAFILLVSLACNAQYITVVASSCINDASGAQIASGSLIVQATDDNDNPIAYRAGSSGQVIKEAVTRTITNGTVSSLQVGDPLLSSPLNIKYRFSIIDLAINRITVYKGVQVVANSGANFNFCIYDPSVNMIGSLTALTMPYTSFFTEYLNNVCQADSNPGSDIGVKANTCEAACIAKSLSTCDIAINPSPFGGLWSYSTDIVFTIPTRLTCSKEAVLNYIGTGKAIKMGPDSLTVSTFAYEPYVVDGCTFTGGASAAFGIYFNRWLTQTKVLHTRFINFGNSSAWNIFYQFENWYNLVDDVIMWSQSGPTQNGIKTNGYDTDGVTSDNGQSRTIITNSLLQFTGPNGIYENGFHSQITNVTVSGPNIGVQLGSWANFNVIDHFYCETSGLSTLGCIMFGDGDSGHRPTAPVTELTVRDSYANMHNLDFSTTSKFVLPAGTSSVLRNALFDNNIVTSVNTSTSYPFVVLNNVANQTGNRATNNSIATALGVYTPVDQFNGTHTVGGSIGSWTGTNGDGKATIDKTAQATNITQANIISLTAVGSYLLTYYEVVTQAATTSSTLPSVCLLWTDADNNTVQTFNSASSTGNALTSSVSGSITVNAKTAIVYASGTNCVGGTGYASSGATPMQYAYHVKAQALPVTN